MFKLIKRIIGLIALIIFLTPIIMMVVMYKDYTAPVADFETHPTLSFTDIAANKLDTFLADDQAESFDFTLSKAEANAALKSIYAAENADFGKTDVSIPEANRKYAIPFGSNGGFKGASMTFDETGLTIEAGVEAGFSGIYYKTTVLIDLDIVIEQVTVDDAVQTQYKLVIKNISFGNMPILWMYDIANFGFSLFSETDLNGFIKSTVEGFGNYDLNTKSIWLNTNDIINLVSDESDPNRAMFEALLGFIDEENLLTSGFGDNQGGISIGLGQMRSTETQYVTSSQIDNETDLQEMFTGQLTSLFISSLGSGSTLNYDMHEDSFNQLLEYYVGDSMNITETFEFGLNIYEISTKPIFARFVSGQVHFTIIMTLNKQGDNINVFQTDFTLKAVPSVSADKQDLVFTIDTIDIGDDTTVSNEKVTTILALVGDSEMIVGNQIILEDFMGEFTAEGVSVNDVLVNGVYLRFVLEPNGANAQILSDLQDAIDDALDIILLNPDYQEVLDAYNTLSGGDTSGMLDAINELTPEQQAALYDSLFSTLGSVDGLEGLIP